MREDEGERDGRGLTRLAARMARAVGLENLRRRQGHAVVGAVGHWSWRGYFADGAQECGRAVGASEGTGTPYLISGGGGGDGGGRRRVRVDEERRRWVGGSSEFKLLLWAWWRGGRVGT